MKTVRNIVIGAVIATLMFAMLVSPVSAQPAQFCPYVVLPSEGGDSNDAVKDENDIPLLGNGDGVDDDLIQVIKDLSGDGITSPDPNDPSKCTNSSDDIVIDIMYIGEGGFNPDCGEFMAYALPALVAGEHLYCRAWNAPSVDTATYYGDAPVHADLVPSDNTVNMCPSPYHWKTTEPKPGAAPPTFEKEFVLGWNLVSLPLTPSDNTTSAVLGGTIAYDSVYSYNAVSNSWDSVLEGKMDPGIGYFVNVTTAGTWNYTGTEAYDSMSIGLESGLNMVGWLNCSDKRINETTSLAGNSTYVSRWNATSQSYEVYNPHAPEPETDMFNDFWMMDRGEGYFVAAKTAFTMSESC